MTIIFLSNLPLDLHQPYKSDFCIRFCHFEIVQEYFFYIASFAKLTSIESELMSNYNIGEIIVNYHKVVSIFKQEIHKFKAGTDRMIL